MIFNKLYYKFGNITFLSQYTVILRQSKISKDMKNFHIYKTFFKNFINIYKIILFIKKSV